VIIADERPRPTRAPKPRDPNWSPDFVLLDEPPRAVFTGVTSEPRVAATRDDRWFRHFDDWAAREDSFWQSDAARFWGMVLLLGAIAVCLWVCCWVAWNSEPVDTAPGASTSFSYRE
jgi:hypothetical protein